jgi:Poxvirus A22 protein
MAVIASFDVGLRNLALCIVDTASMRVLAWEIIDLATSNRAPMETVCGLVRQRLDERAERFRGVACVLVEKQPGRNKTMVRIEAYLLMYYVMTGRAARLVSPTGKLSFSTCRFRGGGRENYKLRKKASVALAQEFIEKTREAQDPAVCAAFASSRKKDDYADSLLQILGYAGWCTTATPLAADADANANNAWPPAAPPAPPATGRARRGGARKGGRVGALVGAVGAQTPDTQQDNVYATTKARRPTDKQRQSGRYSLSNIKHFLAAVSDGDAKRFEEQLANIPGLRKSMSRWFRSVEHCMHALVGATALRSAAAPQRTPTP